MKVEQLQAQVVALLVEQVQTSPHVQVGSSAVVEVQLAVPPVVVGLAELPEAPVPLDASYYYQEDDQAVAQGVVAWKEVPWSKGRHDFAVVVGDTWGVKPSEAWADLGEEA